MLHAFECKHLERSIFKMNLLDNKILLWSSGICALSVFPIIYIPVISDYGELFFISPQTSGTSFCLLSSKMLTLFFPLSLLLSFQSSNSPVSGGSGDSLLLPSWFTSPPPSFGRSDDEPSAKRTTEEEPS